jgi:uncharacterized protein YuzE
MRLIIGATALLVASVAANGQYCEVERDLALEMDLRGVSRIEVRSMSGDLVITGERSPQRVTATGQACVEKRYRDRIDEIRIIEERDDDVLRIIGYVPQRKNADWRIGALHLALTVPDDMPIDVTDSSGDLRSQASGPISIKDSSGDIVLEDINGDVTISIDSSGDIEIRRAGNVDIGVDSSGDIDVRDATSLRIGKDSSGDIDARDIAADVYVGTDSSGSIDVSEVGGDLTVERDGSGDIRYRRVTGSVNIPMSKQ